MTAIAMLFTECKKTASFENYISIADPDDSQEVAFEDVATDVRIVPLISMSPLAAAPASNVTDPQLWYVPIREKACSSLKTASRQHICARLAAVVENTPL